MLQGVQLKRYVVQEMTQNRVTFYFRSPRKGSYYITVYARTVSREATNPRPIIRRFRLIVNAHVSINEVAVCRIYYYFDAMYTTDHSG